MILSRSAHCAFHKAAQYFNVKPVMIGFDPVTFKLDPEEMRHAITPNTIMLVASAPGYAQGVIDPVEEIANVAREHNLWLHVDGCVGGIQLSFMRQMGTYDVPNFDFSVPGVTSISADMHKYGYSPKGASVVLYRNKDIRRHQIFSSMESATYALVNPSVQSTKSGGPMAAAWAALHAIGEEGYRDIVDRCMKACRKVMDAINATGDFRVLGKPQVSMFSIASDKLNVFELADEMHDRGWYLQPQFSTEWSPPNVHITVTYTNLPAIDAFLDDFHASVASLRQRPPLDLNVVREQVNAMLAEHGPDKAFEQLSSMAGMEGGVVPQHMAMINAVLESLPRTMGAKVLADFVNDLYV